MTAAVNVDTHIPIAPGGHVKLQVTVPNVAALGVAERQFILALVDKLAAWTPPSGDDRADAAKPPSGLPAVLRGVGGRQ